MTLSERSRPVFALLLVLSLSLSGCILEAADTSGLAGTYDLFSAQSDGVLLPKTELELLDIRLVLEEEGRGFLRDSDGSGRLHWSHRSGVLSVSAGGRDFSGYSEGRMLILQEQNTGTVFTFVPETHPENQGIAPQALTLLGDWYGWWKTENSAGSMPESWYDCCAEIGLLDWGLLCFRFWDENGSRNGPMAEIYFTWQEDECWHSSYGYFLCEEIAADELCLSADTSVIFLDRLHYETEEESFDGSFYMRPWGDRWEGAPQAQLPFYFFDWYLPLLRSGKSMPDEIPWEEIEKTRAD